jgi:hypothetical protein
MPSKHPSNRALTYKDNTRLALPTADFWSQYKQTTAVSMTFIEAENSPSRNWTYTFSMPTSGTMPTHHFSDTSIYNGVGAVVFGHTDMRVTFFYQIS